MPAKAGANPGNCGRCGGRQNFESGARQRVPVVWLAVGQLDAAISAAFLDAQDGDDAEWLDSENWGWRLWTQVATGSCSDIPLILHLIGGGMSEPTGKAIPGRKAAIDIPKLLAVDENAQAQFDRPAWEWWEEKVFAVLAGLGSNSRGAVPTAVTANMGRNGCAPWIGMPRRPPGRTSGRLPRRSGLSGAGRSWNG